MASSDLARALGVAGVCWGTTTREPWVPGSSPELAQTIISHRLSRLAIDHAESLELEPADYERVKNDALAHTHAAFQLVGHTTHVVEILEAAGLRFLVIKGVALAAQTSSVASRGAGDVDILVAPRDVPALHDILTEASFRPALAIPAPHRVGGRIWRWLDREATYLGHGTQIDVHWRISTQHRLFPPFAELFDRRESVMVADRAVWTLSHADSLAAACYHAYFDSFQPARSLTDVVAVLKSLDLNTPLPPYSRALTRLISGILHLVRDVFPGVVDSEVDAVVSNLPSPPGIVRRRFQKALTTPRVVWELEQNLGALASKFVAEAALDNPLTVAPRFIGKRLFDFPGWSASAPSTSLRHALARRIRVENSRRKRKR